MQQEALIQKASTLGQALALGAAFVLPHATFASAATSPLLQVQANFDTSSLSKAMPAKDFSADMRRATKELGIARSLLDVLSENVEAASLTYLDRLGDILDAAMAVSSDKLPEHSQFLADRLHSVRAELLDSIGRPKTWSMLSKLVNPGAKQVLPERFIVRRSARRLEVSMPDLRAAAYIRSSKGPRTV